MIRHSCLLLLGFVLLTGCASQLARDPVPVSARLDAAGLHIEMSNGRVCTVPRPDDVGPDQGWAAEIECPGLARVEVSQHPVIPDMLPLIQPEGWGTLVIEGLERTTWASSWVSLDAGGLWILSGGRD